MIIILRGSVVNCNSVYHVSPYPFSYGQLQIMFKYAKIASDTEPVADSARGFILFIRTWGSGDFLAALSSRPEAERNRR